MGEVSKVCGIVGCKRREGGAKPFLISALRRVEYRGYDSAGIAVVPQERGSLVVHRVVGRVSSLESRLSSSKLDTSINIGIGHTRWATHGAVSERNAHPHLDCSSRIAVVHNGIIENAHSLREDLERRGHRLVSDVDTEVVAHLLEEALAEYEDLACALRATVKLLEGSWALAAVAEGFDSLVATAHRSPLAVTAGDDGFYLASDMSALVGWGSSFSVLRDGDVVEFNGSLQWSDLEGAPRPARPPVGSRVTSSDMELGGHQDYMEKEIAEQATVAERLLSDLLPGVRKGIWWEEMGLEPFERVRLVGCGTSLHAAEVTARVLRSLGQFPSEVLIASEHPELRSQPGVLTVAFSQSGETADVLAALDSDPGPTVAITNTTHSSLAHRSHAVVDCMAGVEIGVAATKTFTAQVLAGTVFAIAAAGALGRLRPAEADRFFQLLEAVPAQLDYTHRLSRPIAEVVAHLVSGEPGLLFVSRGEGLPYAAEGALKLKEITYRWVEYCPAGELKHGPIALISDGTPVVVVQGGNATKLESNVAEMQSRGAQIFTVGGRNSTFPVITVERDAPWGPIQSVVALQHLARSLAVRLHRNVDKPRNLAKSVTVE